MNCIVARLVNTPNVHKSVVFTRCAHKSINKCNKLRGSACPTDCRLYVRTVGSVDFKAVLNEHLHIVTNNVDGLGEFCFSVLAACEIKNCKSGDYHRRSSNCVGAVLLCSVFAHISSCAGMLASITVRSVISIVYTVVEDCLSNYFSIKTVFNVCVVKPVVSKCY